MKIFIKLVLLVLVSKSVFAQNKIEKSTIQKIFNKSIVEKRNGTFSMPSDKAWKFQNTDSLYFKQDTLIAIQYKSSKLKSMCETITWTFHRKNAFVLNKQSLCNEPPLISVSKYPDNFFTIAIYYVQTKDENGVMIDVLRNDKAIVESFNVINIEDTSEYSKITLVRRFMP